IAKSKIVAPSFQIRIKPEEYFTALSLCNCLNIACVFKWYRMSKNTKKSFTCIHPIFNQEGYKKSNHTAKITASMAEGHVIIYHNLLAMTFSCFPSISFSGEGFCEASIW